MGGEVCKDKIAWNSENSHGGTNFEERNTTTVAHPFAGTNKTLFLVNKILKDASKVMLHLTENVYF